MPKIQEPVGSSAPYALNKSVLKGRLSGKLKAKAEQIEQYVQEVRELKQTGGIDSKEYGCWKWLIIRLSEEA